MQIHTIHYPPKKQLQPEEALSLAIGFFDGVHKGHQAVIKEAILQAKQLGIESAVMTFNPHPSFVVQDGKYAVNYLTSFEEKCTVFEQLGIDQVFVVQFTPTLAALTPAQFVEEVIIPLAVKHVTAGFDFRFGARGAGSMQDMKRLAAGRFTTSIVQKVVEQEGEVSSTRIRQAVESGNLDEVKQLLGRSFSMEGTVVDGDKRGRELGFPTANIEPAPYMIYPKNGVYAVRFFVKGKSWKGVCNVGIVPTFSDPLQPKKRVEVHLLDFAGDIYGEIIRIEWVQVIREEKKFESIDALITQIIEDKQTARNILEN